jgi:hypothetical protein
MGRLPLPRGSYAPSLKDTGFIDLKSSDHERDSDVNWLRGKEANVRITPKT